VDLFLGRAAVQKPGTHEPKMPNVSKFRATKPRIEDADVHVRFGSKSCPQAELAASLLIPQHRTFGDCDSMSVLVESRMGAVA